jgi:hypothetical protein
MRKLKTYNLFLESFQKDTAVMQEYSIYDWFEDLKSDNRKPSNIQRHKVWCEHFIGEGWWDKITNHVDKIFKTFEGVNMEFVNDVLLEVWDQFENKEKSNYFCVLYGHHKDKDKISEIKWSGQRPIMELTQQRKDAIIISILIDIVYPTLFIGFPSTLLRRSKEEEYVTDKKWQCQNFNIDNYSIELGMEDSYLSGTFTLQKVEELMDEAISILERELDIEEVIWDNSRSERSFSTDTEVYDYDVKILLKM